VLQGQSEQRPLQFFDGVLANSFNHRIEFDSGRSQQAAQVGLGDGRELLSQPGELRLTE